MIEHQWQAKPDGYKDYPYDDRFCPVCQLGDSCTKGSCRWSVTTPCIEQVPERVEFDALIAELAEHPVKVHIQFGGSRMRTFEKEVTCRGTPGKWQVGLGTVGGMMPSWYGSNPGGSITFKTIEEGCAAFLRWMRARHYDPYKYSDLYRQEEMARSSQFCCDDD